MDDHKAVCCDLCESWVHVSCDPSLFDDLYANVVQEPSTDTWRCTVCFKLAPVTVSDNYCAAQSSCACLNTRSALPKQFDMFDIPETFLDGTISDGEIWPGDYQIFHCDRLCHSGGLGKHKSFL